jgi:hypothetical protein
MPNRPVKFIPDYSRRVCLACAVCTILAVAILSQAQTARQASMPAVGGQGKNIPSAGSTAACVNVSYAHAGIGLDVPAGLEPQILRDPYDLARFVRLERNKPVLAVTIQAFPINQQVSAGDFADAMTAEVQKSLAVSHLSVSRKEPMPVAGLEGQLRVLNYNFRGAATSAGRLFFVRQENPSAADTQPGLADKVAGPGQLRLCYVLTVELPAERQAAMDAILAGLAGSVKLAEIRQPTDLPITEFQQVVTDYKLGYSIKPPLAWYIDATDNGAELAQTDYVLGGLPMPMVQVIAVGCDGATTSRQFAQRAVEELQKSAGSDGDEIKVVSQKQSKLAGLDAWQVVLEERQPAKDASDAGQLPATIVQRVAIMAGRAGSVPRAYSLKLYCQVRQVQTAEELMEKLAGQFETIDTATAFAATQQAVTTVPAATGPVVPAR